MIQPKLSCMIQPKMSCMIQPKMSCMIQVIICWLFSLWVILTLVSISSFCKVGALLTSAVVGLYITIYMWMTVYDIYPSPPHGESVRLAVSCALMVLACWRVNSNMEAGEEDDCVDSKVKSIRYHHLHHLLLSFMILCVTLNGDRPNIYTRYHETSARRHHLILSGGAGGTLLLYGWSLVFPMVAPERFDALGGRGWIE
eukprot:GHVO01063109.1.p1 GENE.GHVO01063109.1~~GHVO01063109.1.p1  ORF type:complete len:199 (-),score=35.86 GHVO01063109.1:154-750(-)